MVDIPTVDETRRLAYIRYLHHLGREQARLPVPMSSTCILTQHDAVENFLLLAAERFAVTPPGDFKGYWPEFRNKAQIELPLKHAMVRLNDARRALKHHGSHPDPMTIELIVGNVNAFFEEATRLVFGSSYDSISMADAVGHAEVRTQLQKANRVSADGDHRMAMVHLIDAWEELFGRNDGYSHGRLGRDLTFGQQIEWTVNTQTMQQMFRHVDRYGHDSRRLANQIHATTDSAVALKRAMRVVALGIDFGAYRRFQILTPEKTTFADQRIKYAAVVGYAPSREDVEFCLHFVVDASIRMASSEANLKKPAWVPESGNRWDANWETIYEIPGR